jgi:hypothetical protein
VLNDRKGENDRQSNLAQEKLNSHKNSVSEIAEKRVILWHSHFLIETGMIYPKRLDGEADKLLLPNYELLVRQQHSSNMQCGHSLIELLFLHSSGKYPQSAHLTCMDCIKQPTIKIIQDSGRIRVTNCDLAI